MVKYLIVVTIALFQSFSFGYYNQVTYSIIQINTFSENKITSVLNPDGIIIETGKLDFKQLHGYPAIEQDWDGLRIGYHKGRFLAKYKNDYCLVDTNGRIIIDFCDTIESIFLSQAIYKREECDVFLDYLDYGKDVYYQAIRNGETFLYANSGEKIFATPYSGLLFEEYDLYAGKEYYFTRNFDYSGFGLLDKSGAVLLTNDFGQLSYKYQSPSPYYISRQTGVFNAVTKTWEVFDSTGFWHNPVCDDLFLVCANEKYGLFDVVEGMVIPAEYDTIIFQDECGQYYMSGIKPKPLILMQKNRKKTWHLPKKYWEEDQSPNKN